MSQLTVNPFKVFTPEDMLPADVAKLFVDVFTDFPKIRDRGHTLVSGPRGCGKSMIFRYMMPDCQVLSLQCSFDKLPFFSVLISIKNTCPNLTEFRRVDDTRARYVLSEHVLVVFIATKVFASLIAMVDKSMEIHADTLRSFYDNVFADRLRLAGWQDEIPSGTGLGTLALLGQMKSICDRLFGQINQYAKRLSFPGKDFPSYSGALCGYLDFLYPILDGLRKLPFTPEGPSYLLIDDADYLSYTQTQVLNSWISTRTSNAVSIKVSTQLRYKTLSAIGGLPIQSPHDFQDVVISDVYTASGSKYMQRVRDIVQKRLINSGINVTPEEFFPLDDSQEQKIKEIGARIKGEWEHSGKGFRADDDVTRYARPEYFKSLAGQSKSSSTYSYAGFQQLVDISSNLIRFFLEPAAQMFDEEVSLSKDRDITSIRVSIQSNVVRNEANRLMFEEFDRLASEQPMDDDAESSSTRVKCQKDVTTTIRRLQSLVRVLGGTFRQRLISSHAERRVFSVALSGVADEELVSLFELGVEHGYFHKTSIGNKDGTGRTRLYVLSRRLAPHFNLDASSFAGYLWVTSSKLLSAIENPEAFLRRVKHKGDEVWHDSQPLLFD